MSKRLSLTLLLSLCLFAAQSHAGFFDFLKTKYMQLVVDAAFLEMRTGPGRGFPVFHVIEKGEVIKIVKRRTDWYKAETEDGKEGWIQRTDLSKTLRDDGEEVDFSAPGWEDYIDRRWEFGFTGGTFEGADAVMTYGAFHLTPNIAAEARYTETFSQIGNNKMWSINAVHRPFPQWKISPFFTLGAGEIDINPSSALVQTEDRKNPTYTVGAGASIYVSRRFLLRLEYDSHTLLTERENNEEVEEWKAGFSVFF